MKKGKGLIALLLSVTLILTLFSGVAFAEDEEEIPSVQTSTSMPAEDDSNIDNQTLEVDECIEGCILPEGHEGECQTEEIADVDEPGDTPSIEPGSSPEPSVSTSPQPSAQENVENSALKAAKVQKSSSISITDEESFRAAMESGGEAILEKDIALNSPVTIPEGIEVVLDLNGHTITETGSDTRRIINEGTLTIQATGGGTIQNEDIGSFGLVDNYGRLIITGGTYIDNSVGDGASIKNREGAFLTITGGTFQGEAEEGHNQEHPTYWANSRVMNSGTLVISGGVFLSELTSMPVIKQTAGTATIENAMITSQRSAGMEINGGSATLANNTITIEEANSYYASAVAASGGGTVTINSGIYTSAGYGVYIWNSGGTITVKDGTIKGEVAAVKTDGRESLTVPAAVIVEGGSTDGKWEKNNYANASLTVFGGTHTADVRDYLAPGSEITGNPEDGYTVTTHYVAEVDGQKYVSLANAIAAAEGKTVKLLDHIEDAETIEVAGTDITLDLNGKTISGSVRSSGLICIAEGADVTITDDSSEGRKGSIINNYAGSSAYTVYIEAGAKVTLDGGIAITDAAGTSASCGPVYLNANNTTPPELIVKDAVLTSAEGYAIRLSSGTSSSKVTIEGGEFRVTGKEPDEGVIYNARSKFVTIKGGVFHNWIWDSGSLNDHNDCLAEGYGFTLDENKVVTVDNSAPADYIASVAAGGRTFYLTSGDLYDLFAYIALDSNINPVDAEVNIASDTTVTFPADSGYGVQKEEDIPTLTLTVADGASLTGSFPLYVADVVLAGGNVDESMFVSADADGYTVTKDGNTWQGRLNDSSVALLVTHADGTAARFTEGDVALAFNNANANPGSTITLFKDVAHGGVTVAQNLTLDLNGRTYTYNSTANAFSVKSGVTFSIVDNSENQGGTVAVSKSAINSLVCTPSNSEGAVINIGEGVTLNGCALLTGTNPMLNVYGTINTTGSRDAGIYNNGSSTDNSTINLYDGAVIKANILGVYHPGPGTLNVYGGAEITAGDVGIEMRAGMLNVYDGASITSTGTGEPSSAPNGSGATSHNAAVAIAQHATKLPVVFNAYGGTFTGSAAVYESNPEGNDAAAIEKITINIENGMFNGEVESATQEGFISGGIFTVKPATKDIYPGLQAVEEGGNFTIARLQNVYIDGAAGSDDNNGTDAANAVKTLEHALKLVADDGTIYICGTVTVNGSLTVDGIKIERASGFGGTLITVTGADVELTLSNTTIDGKKASNTTGNLVHVTGGATLNIEEETKLINNNETAVQVGENSTLNMNGGEISGNTDLYWGGGIVNDGGTVTLTGGFVTQNHAGDIGGGIFSRNGGKTTLNGATISDNTAGRSGGGIYVQGTAAAPTVFEMVSGTISGNAAQNEWGGGIYGYYYGGDVVIRISGGQITENEARRDGDAIGMESDDSEHFPSMELSGSPTISGDVFLYDKEEGPVIYITGAFAPAEPVELSVNRGAEGTVAVTYENGIEPDATQFASVLETIGLKQDGQNLIWAKTVRIYFNSEDNKTKYKTIYVPKNTTIDAGLAPTLTETGYTLIGWQRYGVGEIWDFATDTATSNMTLLAMWSLNAPDIAVSADVDSPHIGTEAVLTATPSHDLDGVTYTYQWYKDGEPLTGETGNQLTVSESGSYTVKVKASDGAKESAETESAPVEITVDGHVYVPEVTAPTCTEQGYTTYTCAVCGDSYVDDYTPAEGHQAAAEWLSDGTSHWHACTMCGTKLDEAAHSFAWVTDKEATATEAGSKHEECSVCGYKKAAVEIPATGTGTMPDQTKPGDGQGAATTPQTGDNSNMLLWIILCIAAAGALAGTFAYKKIRAERK